VNTLTMHSKQKSRAPGWLSRLSICLQLRSYLRVLGLSPVPGSLLSGESASPSPPAHAHSRSNKTLKKKKKKRICSPYDRKQLDKSLSWLFSLRRLLKFNPRFPMKSSSKVDLKRVFMAKTLFFLHLYK